MNKKRSPRTLTALVLASAVSLLGTSCNYVPKKDFEQLQTEITAKNRTIDTLETDLTRLSGTITPLQSDIALLKKKLKEHHSGGAYAATEQTLAQQAKINAALVGGQAINRREDLARNIKLSQSITALSEQLLSFERKYDGQLTRLRNSELLRDQKTRDALTLAFRTEMTSLKQTFESLKIHIDGRIETQHSQYGTLDTSVTGLKTSLDGISSKISGIESAISKLESDLKKRPAAPDDGEKPGDGEKPDDPKDPVAPRSAQLGAFTGYRIVLCYDDTTDSATDNTTLKTTLVYISPMQLDRLSSTDREYAKFVQTILSRKELVKTQGNYSQQITDKTLSEALARQYVEISKPQLEKLLEKEKSLLDANGIEIPLHSMIRRLVNDKKNTMYFRVEKN